MAEICSVPNCGGKVLYQSSGLCSPHHQRMYLYGRLHTIRNGQTNHPLYFIWNDGKNKKKFCNEWDDFYTFLKDVGERPNKNYKLIKKDKTKLFNKDNFEWTEWKTKNEGETSNEYQRRLRKENRDKYKNLELQKNFGLTLEKYNKLLEEQNFVCAICGEKEKVIHHINNLAKSLAVDHCHRTKKIRGLLCQRCNRVLGKVRDSIDLLDKMKAYLNAHNCS